MSHSPPPNQPRSATRRILRAQRLAPEPRPHAPRRAKGRSAVIAAITASGLVALAATAWLADLF